jgi:hypothetical protein
MDKDNTYQTFATFLVKDVPNESFEYLIKLFMDKASMNMGSDYSPKVLTGTVEIIKGHYNYIPICYVASAFIKGSLGDYGPGRLVPRTVYAWLNAITIEYNRDEDHKRNILDINTVHFSDLEKYPLGKAINKKIDWLKSGKITSDDWDRISLKELAERIGQGIESVPEIFGVTSKDK